MPVHVAEIAGEGMAAVNAWLAKHPSPLKQRAAQTGRMTVRYNQCRGGQLGPNSYQK
jgi:hypothetical protein